MSIETEKGEFLDAVRASIGNATFIKLTLGKYRGDGEDRNCVASPLVLKNQPHVRFQTRRGKHEFTENALPPQAIEHLSATIGAQYLSAVLFTSAGDISLVYNKKRVPRLTRSKATCTAAASTEHNRQKSYLVDPKAAYLAHLGVTVGDGEVKPSMYAKFRQICRYVEIVDQLLAASELRDVAALRIVDVGAGKGYLTFALHEHLSKSLGKSPVTRGIETTVGLVETCNAIATKCGMSGLSFEARPAESFAPGSLDILIALHACDTATDDAIRLGIEGNAGMILCAPCCQHEIAPQLQTRDTPLSGLLKYGLLKQRQADLFTDASRALLLESRGYEVRIIEFISTEHTAKNLMIAAVRSTRVDRAAAAQQLEQLTAIAGFKTQRLKDSLA